MEVIKFLGETGEQIKDTLRNDRKSTLADLSNGFKGAAGNYRTAMAKFDPYATTGLTAFNQYADATGVNGQEGYDRSVGNFRASPAYEWQRDQGTDAVARKASSLGALGSGNTMTAIADYSSHLADQEYDKYLSRLDGIAKTGYDATGKQAGLEQGIGNLRYQVGSDRAGVKQNYSSMNTNAKLGLANGIAGAIQGGYQAGQNAAANRWNFGMQGLNLLAGLAGSFA